MRGRDNQVVVRVLQIEQPRCQPARPVVVDIAEARYGVATLPAAATAPRPVTSGKP